MLVKWNNAWPLPWTWWGITIWTPNALATGRSGAGPQTAVARARTMPHRFQSPAHVTAQNALSVLSNRFAFVITARQRDAWNAYAPSLTVTPPTGPAYSLLGKEAYIRSNRPRILANMWIVDDGPTTPGYPVCTEPIYTISSDFSQVEINFNQTDPWVTQAGAAMFVWSSRPQNNTRNTFSEQYRLIAYIPGDPVNPPISPSTVPLWIGCSYTMWVTLRCSATYADGRLSL